MKKCKTCRKKSVGVYLLQKDGDIIDEKNLCGKHWVESEGEYHLEEGLKIIDGGEKDISYMHPKVAEEIIKQFPDLARKYPMAIRRMLVSDIKKVKIVLHGLNKLD